MPKAVSKWEKYRMRKAQGIRALRCSIQIAPGVHITELDIHKYAIDDDALRVVAGVLQPAQEGALPLARHRTEVDVAAEVDGAGHGPRS